KLRGLDSWAKIAKLADADLFKALASEDLSDRLRAQRELVRRGDKHRAALLKLVEDSKDQPITARIAALAALQSFSNEAVREAFRYEDVEKAACNRLADAEPDSRRRGAEGLPLSCARGEKPAHEALVERLGDPEPEVRRAAALAIGRIAAPGAADALVNAFK